VLGSERVVEEVGKRATFVLTAKGAKECTQKTQKKSIEHKQQVHSSRLLRVFRLCILRLKKSWVRLWNYS